MHKLIIFTMTMLFLPAYSAFAENGSMFSFLDKKEEVKQVTSDTKKPEVLPANPAGTSIGNEICPLTGRKLNLNDPNDFSILTVNGYSFNVCRKAKQEYDKDATQYAEKISRAVSTVKDKGAYIATIPANTTIKTETAGSRDGLIKNSEVAKDILAARTDSMDKSVPDILRPAQAENVKTQAADDVKDAIIDHMTNIESNSADGAVDETKSAGDKMLEQQVNVEGNVEINTPADEGVNNAQDSDKPLDTKLLNQTN